MECNIYYDAILFLFISRLILALINTCLTKTYSML